MHLVFTAPAGWEMPSDARPGTPFQAVGTFIADEDGEISMTEIDGTPLEAEEVEVQMKEKPSKKAKEDEKEAGETEVDSMMKRAAAMGIFDRR